jgi:c(7)-type cytochrome triheme protein
VRNRAFWLAAFMLFVSLIFLAVPGCEDRAVVVVDSRPVFSHERHVKGEEMKCSSCHRQAEKGDEAGMPTIKSCMKCHEGIDEKKPESKRVAVYVVNEKPVFSSVTRLSDEVKFSHKTHVVDGKIECATCHKGVESAKTISNRLRVEKRECVQCHAKQKVAQADNNCQVCHTTISKDTKPQSHLHNWRELHGRVAANTPKNTFTGCSQCHTENSCVACHRVELPRNHTNHWRQQGHGVTATLDRTGCSTCHTEDSCLRCHQQVAPRSHRAKFSSQHCVNCHIPLKDNSCNVCHKATPSHSLSPRLPNNLVHQRASASDCRTCHFGLKLGHLDNGDSCLACHSR